MTERVEGRNRAGAARVWATLVRFVAGLVRWAGLIVTVILVARVLLTVGGANPHNAIAGTINAWSDTLAWGFKDLFMPADLALRVLVNYGLAALFWLIASAILSRLIRRLG
ncbi:MAG TPA: hypothetical protein VF444_16370 [Pseudonocardiaceae bacterium]